MTFRIEVCAISAEFALAVMGTIEHAAAATGVSALVAVAAHDHGPPGRATALVAASDRRHGDPLDRCVAAATGHEQLVIPVIDDVRTWLDRLPDSLGSMNAIAMSVEGAGRKVLEAAGVLTPLRGVFLSHRRSDGGAMALQLAGALRQHGLNTFVDVLDIPPNEIVQARILAALDQMACLVLLESPDAIESSWVMKEVVYAQQRHLGVLSLCWAENDPPNGPRRRFAQFDAGNRIDVRAHLVSGPPSVTLSAGGVDIAIAAILREFSQALYFRRANLERELLAAAPHATRTAPWRFELRGPEGNRLIGLAPYRPDALDLHQLAMERDRSGVDTAVLVHSPISPDTAEALMLTWIGDKGPETALDADHLDQLL